MIVFDLNSTRDPLLPNKGKYNGENEKAWLETLLGDRVVAESKEYSIEKGDYINRIIVYFNKAGMAFQVGITATEKADVRIAKRTHLDGLLKRAIAAADYATAKNILTQLQDLVKTNG